DAADRTPTPCRAELRPIGRFLPKPLRSEPCIKLAVGQMICVFDKATDFRKRAQHVVKFRLQIGVIQFRRRGHLGPAVEEAIEIRVVWRLLEFTYARQKSLFEAWRGLSEIAASH